MARKQKGVGSNSVSFKFFCQGIVILVCTLIPDFTTAECMCNLSYTDRQARDQEIKLSAKQIVNVQTYNTTQYLKGKTTPPFNLTAELMNLTVGFQGIGEFILAGKIANLLWANFSSGYEGTNNSKLQTWACNSCSASWLNLSNYLSLNYERDVWNKATDVATKYSYPLGYYRPSPSRTYNYSGLNITINININITSTSSQSGYYKPSPSRTYNYSGLNITSSSPSLCSCSSQSGFFYKVRFTIDPTIFPSYYYDISMTSGRLLVTDLELAVDDFASNVFGETYIQSSFNAFDPTTNNSTFNLTLYFKDGYNEWWNVSNSAGTINDKLSNMIAIPMRYLNNTLNITAPPQILACNWYVKNGTHGSCYEPTTLATTSTTDLTSISTLTSTVTSPSNTETSSSSQSTSTPDTPSTSIPSSSSSSATEITPLVSSSSQTDRTTQPTQLSTTIRLQGSKLETTTSISSSSNPTNSSTRDSTSSSLTSSSKVMDSNSTRTSPSQTSMIANQTQMTALTKKVSNSSTTPFDDDPFFQAVVPVMTKVYNDEKMLRGIGATAAPVTEQTLFYTLTLPAILGLLLFTGLLLLLCQTDWIGLLTPGKTMV